MQARSPVWFLLALFSTVTPAAVAQPTPQQATDAMHRAVRFFREHASAGGGYVYQISADLSKREGEGKVGPHTAWIQPPATPSVGMAYLSAYRRTGDQMLMRAARETAAALIDGQLRSGGWDNKIEFSDPQRQKYAYRVEAAKSGRLRNTTTYDDDKSQSVIRFLMQLDQELEFEDQAVHEAVMYGLDAVVRSQYANGAWPQR
ncbi:MAG: pectate lyase, partial [Pirellulales bacterium]|nr:pectate lyase [Pirellulales bacterium]